MKTLFLSTFALLIAFLSQAQFKKGDITLAGSLAFSQQTPKPDNVTNSVSNSKNTYISFNPSIGWVVSDDMIYGINLSYNHSKSSYVQSYSKQDGYGAGVFLRKYKYLGSKFYFFAEGGLNAMFYKQDQNNSPGTIPAGSTGKQTNISLNFYPGIAYVLTRRWQLETGFPQLLSLYYGHTSRTDRTSGSPDVHSSVNNYGLSSSLSSTYQLSLGLRYFITKS